MAYHLKLDRPVAEEVRRIAGEEIETATDQLTGKGDTNRDKAIHESRKSIKKIRAVLRLIKTELGDIYREEDTRLRNIGRKLSEFRDAGAIIETFDALKDKYRDELGRHTLDSIRRGLIVRKEQAEQTSDIARALRHIATGLRSMRKRLKTWPLATDGFAAIAPGLESTYRRGRKGMAFVCKNPRPENYHEWRKRVKYHWYHVRLLESLWTDVMQAYEKSLKEVETWLGEDHNLVVLREKVVAEPDFYGGDKEIELFIDLMEEYHKELRQNALSAGERIFEERPSQFNRRMKHLWDAWQAQPKTLEVA
jgi:CHAD domain-containing protein